MVHRAQHEVPRYWLCILSAFKRPLFTTTSSIQASQDMPPQTITEPLPKLTVPTTLHWAYRSPGRL
jgi:hypothetical protein